MHDGAAGKGGDRTINMTGRKRKRRETTQTTTPNQTQEQTSSRSRDATIAQSP